MVTELRPLAMMWQPTAVVRSVPVQTNVPSHLYLRPLLEPVAEQAGQFDALRMPVAVARRLAAVLRLPMALVRQLVTVMR